MTGVLTEKLNTIAENQPKIFEAGVEAGKKAEWDTFWDAYQENGTRTDYQTSFSGGGWTRETFRPKYDITANDGYMLFRYHNKGHETYDLAEWLESLGIKIRILYSVQYMFANANVSRIPPLDFSVGMASMQQTFISSKIVTIDKLKVAERTTYEGAFMNASKLQNLTIEGTIAQNGLDLHWSTNLSRASIESVINALSATTSGLSVAFSQTAVDNAFTADEWNAFIATKQNWTISLI